MLKNNFIFKFIFVAILFIAGFCFAPFVEAATLSLTPSLNSVSVGNSFSVKLFVNTQGKVINDVNGVIKFPTDLVEVTAVNYADSIFTLWAEQPVFSNASGQISFDGGIPTPGYTGSAGKVLSVSFRAKKVGVASLTFGNASVLENDGLGTDILISQYPTSVDIISAVPEAEKPVTPVVPATPSLLPAPVIYSSVFTNQESWYSAKAGVITWNLPTGATTVQTAINNKPSGAPTISYSPVVFQREVKNLTDGVWYFHLRYAIGEKLSAITHYKIQIDSQSPTELTATQINNNDGSVSLDVKATDELSGIDYYTISVDNQPEIKVPFSTASSPILLQQLTIGSHQVLITAYDKAGNKKEITIQVVVNLISAPVIDKYTKEINIGGRIEVSGTTSYPGATVKIIIKPETGNEVDYSVIADQNGKFSFVSNPMGRDGKYQFWAYIISPDNINGPSSTALNIVVKKSFWLGIKDKILGIRITSAITPIMIGLIALLIALFGWYKYFILRKRFALVEKRANDAFKLLLKRARRKITALDKLQKQNNSSLEEKKALLEIQETIEEIENLKKSELE